MRYHCRNQPSNCTFCTYCRGCFIRHRFRYYCWKYTLHKRFFNRGTKFSESRLLEYSIVLTGLTLNLTDIMSVGWQGVLFIILQMTLTIIVTYFIGKLLRFGKNSPY